jgi:hypothetical protein
LYGLQNVIGVIVKVGDDILRHVRIAYRIAAGKLSSRRMKASIEMEYERGDRIDLAQDRIQSLLSSRLLSKNLKIRIYKRIILPVVLHGCETWSLTLREEHRLRVFENRVLRRMFGPKRDEVTGEWRKLHNKELNDLYSSPSIIKIIKSRRMRLAGNVT